MEKVEKKINDAYGDLLDLEDFKMPDDNANEAAVPVTAAKVP